MTTISSPEEAAALYAQHALLINVPLNDDLNHRFFEVMAAGVPQVVFGDSGLVGEHRHLAEGARCILGQQIGAAGAPTPRRA